MTITVYPAPSGGGGIKSVQRGVAAAAGTVTITAVNVAKSFVTIFGTASSGEVAGTGTIGGSSGGVNSRGRGGTTQFFNNSAGANYSTNTATITSGTNNLIAGVVQGYLNSSTQLIVSGPCRWEVVESL